MIIIIMIIIIIIYNNDDDNKSCPRLAHNLFHQEPKCVLL